MSLARVRNPRSESSLNVAHDTKEDPLQMYASSLSELYLSFIMNGKLRLETIG